MEKLKKIGQNETKQDKLIASAGPDWKRISITIGFTEPYTGSITDGFCDDQILPPLPPKGWWKKYSPL